MAAALAGRTDVAPLLSLAGRTERPVPPPVPFRIGGFGGAEGLAGYLRTKAVAAVIDATHPFAARISANAVAACRLASVPLAAFTRPPWVAEAADRWTSVPDIAAAAASLGAAPKRVFLTTGRLDLAAFAAAPHHHYLIRTIDPPDAAVLPPNHRIVLARGPFTFEGEEALMRAEAIDVLVTKNSGASATGAKLEAARRMGVPVIMVEPPSLPDRPTFYDFGSILGWIEAQRPRP